MSKTKPVRPYLAGQASNASLADNLRVFLAYSNQNTHAVALQLAPPASSLDTMLEAFKEHTDVPLQIPLAAYFSLLSTHLMNLGVKLEVRGASLPMDIWTVVLADSGAGKTFAYNMMADAAKKALGIEPNFSEVASAAAYAQQLADNNNTLWFCDEFAQVLAQIENINSPMGQCKEYLLKTYDGKLIERITKANEIRIERPCLSILGLNTVESFLNKVSEESFTDGFSQRFSYFMAKPDGSRSAKDFAWYDMGKMKPVLEQAWQEVGNLQIHPTYTVSEQAFRAYEIAYVTMFGQYGIAPSFYRRLTFKSWKYALMYHIVLGKSSSELDQEDVAWAMRMTRQHLIDLAEILEKYNYSKLAQMVDKVVALRKKFLAQGKTLTARDVAQNCHGVKTAAEARGLLSLCEEIYPAAKPSTPPAANAQQMKQAA